MFSLEKTLEHRWGSRVHLRKPTELKTIHGPDPRAVLQNASLSGAFVETALKPALFSRVSIHPAGVCSSGLDAWVVRVDASGIGIEWLEPASEMAIALLPRLSQSVA
jgi:hypothetical protein